MRITVQSCPFQEGAALTFPWISKVNPVLCSSLDLLWSCLFWLWSLTRPLPCMTLLRLLATEPVSGEHGCRTADCSHGAAAALHLLGLVLRQSWAGKATSGQTCKKKRRKKGFYFCTWRLKGFQMIANKTNNIKLRLQWGVIGPCLENNQI